MRPVVKNEVVCKSAEEVQWWLRNRLKKFRDLSHKSMAINPFMGPVLMALHSQTKLEELAELLLTGHFMVGHSTGFGKLVDEKILPNVFGTQKMSKARRKTPPFNRSVFSEIDHLVFAEGSTSPSYLSLKASRWTIQLTMAMKLNNAFANLISLRKQSKVSFKKIVVGVIYGMDKTLTDKFDLVRGIRRKTKHDVKNIATDVDVVSGRNFWTWIDRGEEATQDWVMEGVLKAVEDTATDLSRAKEYLDEYRRNFASEFSSHTGSDGEIDWLAILRSINR